MNQSKIKNVIILTNKERYDYSIREFVKLEKIWAVSTPEGWVTIVDKTGEEIFPIWPHQEVAEICLLDEMKYMADISIKAIDYDKFREFCIPDMIEDKILFGVFYNNVRECIAVKGEDLSKDLDDEENGEF